MVGLAVVLLATNRAAAGLAGVGVVLRGTTNVLLGTPSVLLAKGEVLKRVENLFFRGFWVVVGVGGREVVVVTTSVLVFLENYNKYYSKFQRKVKFAKK